MRTLSILLVLVAACGGDDGVHHLPDAPVPPASRGIYVTLAVNSVLVFELDATGNAAPKRQITGANTTMNLPIGMDYDTANDEIYVANRQGGTVTVFGAMQDGNVTPTRVLQATGLGSAEAVALTPAGDVFISCCPGCGSGLGGQNAVFHFAKGATTSDRVIGGATNTNTLFTNASSLAFDSQTSELYVANSFGGNISAFPADASGDVAPLRAFVPSGVSNLQSAAFGLNTLFVTSPGTPSGVILMYDAGATSPTPAAMIPNMPPLQVSYPGGIYIDPLAQPVIYLVDYSGNAIHIIQTSGSAPNLSVASVKTITGPATQLNMPISVKVVK